jgi:hypothetical protein
MIADNVIVVRQKEAGRIIFAIMTRHFILDLAVRQKNGKGCCCHDKPCDKYGTEKKKDVKWKTHKKRDKNSQQRISLRSN